MSTGKDTEEYRSKHWTNQSDPQKGSLSDLEIMLDSEVEGGLMSKCANERQRKNEKDWMRDEFCGVLHAELPHRRNSW